MDLHLDEAERVNGIHRTLGIHVQRQGDRTDVSTERGTFASGRDARLWQMRVMARGERLTQAALGASHDRADRSRFGPLSPGRSPSRRGFLTKREDQRS